MASSLSYQLIVVPLAAVTGCVFTWLVREMATKRKWVRAPESKRHIHVKAVPRLGGTAVFCALWMSVGLVLLLRGDSQAIGETILPVALAASVVFSVGLIDDAVGVKPFSKIAAITCGALILCMSGVRITALPFCQGAEWGASVASYAITVCWLLILTNAFNLIDGLDGLAAGLGIVTAAALAVCVYCAGHAGPTLWLFALCGALLGFLRYNSHPATIFLGDCGSLMIGFLLGAASIQAINDVDSPYESVFTLVLFGLPLLDVFLALFRRFLSMQGLFEGDREHIHHKLLDRGLSQRGAVAVLYGACIASCTASLVFRFSGAVVQCIVLAAVAGATIGGVRSLHYQIMVEVRSSISRLLQQRRVIANDLHIRNAARAFLDLESDRSPCELCAVLIKSAYQLGFDAVCYQAESGGPLFSPKCPRSYGARLWLPEMPTAEDNFGWAIRLSLQSSRLNHCGYLHLYRRSPGVDPLYDSALLSQVYAAALADALCKCANDKGSIGEPSHGPKPCMQMTSGVIESHRARRASATTVSDTIQQGL